MANEPDNDQWEPGLYDGKHSFVWKLGASVIESLAPQPGERILDPGCGTGQRNLKAMTVYETGCGCSAGTCWNRFRLRITPPFSNRWKRLLARICFEIPSGMPTIDEFELWQEHLLLKTT